VLEVGEKKGWKSGLVQGSTRQARWSPASTLACSNNNAGWRSSDQSATNYLAIKARYLGIVKSNWFNMETPRHHLCAHTPSTSTSD